MLSQDPETGKTAYKEVIKTFVRETDTILHVKAGESEIKTTREHPFWVEGSGFVCAESLKAGDNLRLASGEETAVEEIWEEPLDERVQVYNFEVADFHTYFVSELGVLVHNRYGGSRDAGKYHTFYQHELYKGDYMKSDSVQFRKANKAFLEKMNSDYSFRKKILSAHPEVKQWINKPNLSTSPTGFTWHHYKDAGILKLVDRADHSYNFSVYHPTGRGGRNIWGGGNAGRKGKIK